MATKYARSSVAAARHPLHATWVASSAPTASAPPIAVKKTRIAHLIEPGGVPFDNVPLIAAPRKGEKVRETGTTAVECW